MTVVQLTTNLARGGAETQVARLSAALSSRGWKVTVISLLTPAAFEQELKDAGVPVFSLGMQPGTSSPLAAARLARILRKLRPRILHSHMFHANLLGRAIRCLCPVPVVISTIHSLAESSRGSGDTRLRDRVYRATDWLADATVAVCEQAVERHAAAKAVPRAKLRVIPNGVDTNRFRPDAERRLQARRQLGIGPEFTWLAAGRLMWKKDYETMLRAFAQLSGGLLLIAGAGPREAELHDLAGRLGANARFLGLREDVQDLMSACDGFVMSSVVEGLPMALIEAASSGLPSVATRAGGTAEIVIPERTGYLVPPGDPGALREALSRIMSLSEEERRRMGLAAREHAVARFEIEVVAGGWEQTYRELMESAMLSELEQRR